jgi:hypothetical protein
VLARVSQLKSYFTLLQQNSLILTCHLSVNLVSLKVDQGSSHQNARLYLLYKLLRILVCMTKSQPFMVA